MRISLYSDYLSISILAFSGTINALAPSSCEVPTRRSAMKQLCSTGAAVISTSLSFPQSSDALEACRPKARNCIRTTWTSPSSVNKAEAVEAIRSVLNTYPKNGQNGVDCSGWSLVNDSLDEQNIARLEYRSCVGPAALAINLGKPFIDDLKLEIEETQNGIQVQVKSSSRMGSSDLSVNKKRIDFLGDQLRLQGWSVPSLKYGA